MPQFDAINPIPGDDDDEDMSSVSDSSDEDSAFDDDVDDVAMTDSSHQPRDSLVSSSAPPPTAHREEVDGNDNVIPNRDDQVTDIEDQDDDISSDPTDDCNHGDDEDRSEDGDEATSVHGSLQESHGGSDFDGSTGSVDDQDSDVNDAVSECSSHTLIEPAGSSPTRDDCHDDDGTCDSLPHQSNDIGVVDINHGDTENAMEIEPEYATTTIEPSARDASNPSDAMDLDQLGAVATQPWENTVGRRRIREDITPRDDPSEKRPKLEAPKRRAGLREAHERHPPKWHDDYVMFAAISSPPQRRNKLHIKNIRIPRNYREAIRSKESDYWRSAMQDEVVALRKKNVLIEIPRSDMPDGQQAIKTMWVYAVKTDNLGNVVRFRARLVARGDKQRQGIDYQETFSPVARMATFRLVLALSMKMNLSIYQGDINTAYLNANLQIKQYVDNLPGFPCESQGHIYMVNKALYGLRQSGREWNSEINAWMLQHGFIRSEIDPCLYIYRKNGIFAMVLIYVDDLLCATNAMHFKQSLFAQLDQAYGIKDQGLLHKYLGIEVEQSNGAIKIHQAQYCQAIIDKFKFTDAHASAIPMEVNLRLTAKDETANAKRTGLDFPFREFVGSVMYLATCTRPDVAYTIGQLSRFVSSPTMQHIGTAKRLLRYLVGTVSNGIVYRHDATQDEPMNKITIHGYCDSDWGSDPDTRKSVTGYVLCLSGGAVSWASRRQTIVAQSTAEAEYVAACEASMEGTGLRNILTEIDPDAEMDFALGIDNQAAYVMATNPTYSRRTRHIELRWHYVRDQVIKKKLRLWKVKSVNNLADILTKALPRQQHDTLSNAMGMLKAPLPKPDALVGGVLESRLK